MSVLEREDPLGALSLTDHKLQMPLSPAFQLSVFPEAGPGLGQVASERHLCVAASKTQKGVLELGKCQEREHNLLEARSRIKTNSFAV